jgi:hypothetical protein
MNPRDVIEPVLRWWRRRHPGLPIEHRGPPKARDKSGPVEHGPTKAPFSRARRRERNRARERAHAAGQHPSYPNRR